MSGCVVIKGAKLQIVKTLILDSFKHPGVSLMLNAEWSLEPKFSPNSLMA